METPLVSVCIPAYQADQFLEETLKSVAGQSYPNWEVIVTEDGSADDTEQIVRNFALTCSQPVSYSRHAKNQGLPATRNSGIQASHGDWIAFLDSDDLWAENHLETLVAESRRSPCDMVFAGTTSFENDLTHVCGQCIPLPEDLQNLPVAIFAGTLSILPSSVMIRRDAFDRFGPISVSYPHVNDTEFWLRILRAGGTIAYSGQATCFYRKHASSMSRSMGPLLKDCARLCESHSDWEILPATLRRNRPADLYRWAAHATLSNDPAEAARFLENSLRLQPMNPKAIGLWVKTIWQARKASALEREAV